MRDCRDRREAVGGMDGGRGRGWGKGSGRRSVCVCVCARVRVGECCPWLLGDPGKGIWAWGVDMCMDE